MDKQINFISDHFNFANVSLFASFYELMKIQVHILNFLMVSFLWNNSQKIKC